MDSPLEAGKPGPVDSLDGATRPGSDEAPIIRVRNLNVRYGVKEVVRNVNVDVWPRQITAMIGPSGCGKSTMLKAISRLLEEEDANARVSGQVEWRGTDVYSLKGNTLNDYRRRVIYIGQSPLIFRMSVFENVVIGLKYWRPKYDKECLYEAAEAALKRVALWDSIKEKLTAGANELSAGEQQRLCIARALTLNAEVLLMDEPTAFLDPISSTKIEEWLDEIAQTVTILIVTHNMQQAARVSKRTMNVYLGELVEEGDTQAIFTTPKERRTQDYITGRFG